MRSFHSEVPLLFACLLLLCVANADVGRKLNVVFLNMWQSKSHGRTMLPLAETLAARGHHVAIYSPVSFSIGKWPDPVVTLETVLPEDRRIDDAAIVDHLFWYEEMGPDNMADPHQLALHYLIESFGDDDFNTVLETKWDVVIFDELFPAGPLTMALKLNQVYGTKIISFSTTDSLFTISTIRQLGRHPVTSVSNYIPTRTSSYDITSFALRLRVIRNVLVEAFTLGYLSELVLAAGGHRLDLDGAGQWRVNAISSLALSDYSASLFFPAPINPNCFSVGNLCSETRPLPDDLLAFVSDPSSKGTIYVAFGSIVNWAAAPPGVVESFLEALNEFTHYRVVWSYKGKTLSGAKKHILITPWAPQNDLLAHPKTVVFFTHGGLKSLKEGLCAGTPMLFMPFFADQTRNTFYGKHRGFAESIYKLNVTAGEIVTKIKRIVETPSYRKNARKISAIMRDNVMDQLVEGAVRVETAARIDRPESFRTKAVSWIDFLFVPHLFAFLSIVGILSR